MHFVAGRLKTAVLLQKPWFTAFLSRMSRKTQNTRFEDNILRKLANEDKPQVVTPWPSPSSSPSSSSPSPSPGQDGSKRVLLREEMDDWEERGPRAEDVASKWDIYEFWILNLDLWTFYIKTFTRDRYSAYFRHLMHHNTGYFLQVALNIVTLWHHDNVALNIVTPYLHSLKHCDIVALNIVTL